MLLVFMSVFFVRNLMLPMVSDDIPYAFIWDGEDKGNLFDGVGPRERITSFGDIVRSQYSHYMTWGGRIIGIGLTQLFAWEGKGLFNVLNTLVFTALTLLLFRIGTGKKLSEMNATMVPDSRSFPHGALDVWQLCVPMDSRHLPALPTAIRQGLLDGRRSDAQQMESAADGFCRPLCWLVCGDECCRYRFCHLLCSDLVLAAEATQGMDGGGLCLPLHRLWYEYNPGLPEDMYWTPLMYSINYIECFYPVVSKQIPLLLLIGYYVWHLPKGQRWNKTTQFQTLMVAGSMMVMLILIFVPVAPARAGFFPTCAVILASLSALRELLKEKEAIWQRHRRLIQGFVAVSLVLWVVTTSICLYIDWDVRQQWMSRIDYINAHQDQDIVVVHQIDVPPIADELPDWWLYNCVSWNTDVLAWGSDLEPRPEGSHNLMYAQYYGWKKVITDGEDRRKIE